ncbi:MAG TPA: tRNA (adenosine(37)-N6)-threonylcarbamoyltransferase complex dimerization subunit type 1 TsaB [Aeromonadales bacterium]|nr:tRNA (adenosine(37)-N6)-threonylcarbamoyltransferase complex dimerization subunit type 1 TsaB [Aeromonadales bacterium]
MKTLLAIDTTTEACSVAIASEGVIFEKFEIAPRLHGELILQMVDDLLQQAKLQLRDIDEFIVNCGPGAFTGIRVGISVVQGLAYAVCKPVIPVNSLQVLANGVQLSLKDTVIEGTHIAVAMDARLNEVYWQCFSIKNDFPVEETTAMVSAVEKVEVPDYGLNAKTCCAGTGWSAYAEKFQQRFNCHFSVNSNCLYPRASWAISLANVQSITAVEAELIMPVYLRDKVAKTTKERNQLR